MPEDTLPKLLIQNYKKWGDKQIALYKKRYGIWQEYSWKDYYENVKRIALGLKYLGFQHGDRLFILGDSNPEWVWAAVAAQAMGGIGCGAFPDCTTPEVLYLMENSDATFAVVDDQEQVDKFLEIKGKLPNLKKVIYWDAKGLWSYTEPILLAFDELQALGHEQEQLSAESFEKLVASGSGDDLAFFFYTSGTIGQPKGVMMNYRNIFAAINSLVPFFPFDHDDNYLSIFPAAWIGEFLFCVGLPLTQGLKVSFAEEVETVNIDMREAGPQLLAGSPRVWEGIASTVQLKTGDAGFLKRFCYNEFLPVGFKAADLSISGEKSNLFWRTLYALANVSLFRPIKDKHGILQLKHTMNSTGYLSPSTTRFMYGLGAKIRQVYGSSEGGVLTAHEEYGVDPATVGVPLLGVGVRISDEGEILLQGNSIFMGYHKNPEASVKSMYGGWFHSGDAGYINTAGHLVFMDRLVDLGELANGAKYSPIYLESSLRFSPFVKDAMVVGGKETDFLAVLVNISFDNVAKWAENNRIVYTTYADLSQKQAVIELIKAEVERLNKALPEAIRLRKFCVLHKEFDPDEAEMTRTHKLKRGVTAGVYGDLTNAIFENKDGLYLKTEVKYRDGSRGMTEAFVKINQAD